MSGVGLTAEEARWTESIRQLLASCSQAGDARKAQAYADCFAEEGVLELAECTIVGREAIRDWMSAPSVIPPPKNGLPGFVSHHLTTSHIAFSGSNTGTARTYWLVTSATGLDHNGFYVDALRREGDRWLIAHRRPRTLWTAPDSVLR